MPLQSLVTYVQWRGPWVITAGPVMVHIYIYLYDVIFGFLIDPNVFDVFAAGVLVCKTVPFVQTTAIVTGILTMTCIAIERYQGIVFPLKMRRQYSSRRAYKMLGSMLTCLHRFSLCICIKVLLTGNWNPPLTCNLYYLPLLLQGWYGLLQ